MAASSLSLSYFPRPWQFECHARLQRFSVLVLHRRAGKTELALMELIDKALACQLDLPFYAYVCPFLRQAKVVAWARLKQRVSPLIRAGVCEISESDLSVTFLHNQAVIRVLGADNPDALRGVRLDGAVLDEVAQMKPEVWVEIIRPALADRNGWALFIGTPKGINLFSELYFYANSGKDPAWTAARYGVFDTHTLKPAEIEALRRVMTEEAFRREMLCDFAAAGDNQLISLNDAEAAAAQTYTERDYSSAPKVLGVDPARFGDDRSVIFPRQGLVAMQPTAYQGIDNMRLADKVARKIDSWEPDATFIDEGNGAGVIDRLRQLGYDVQGVHFGGKASEPRFKNKRAEMWWEMRDWLVAGGGIPNLLTLKQELATPTYDYDKQDHIILEPKADIKARGMPSPDLADALALTFAMPVRRDMSKKAQARRMGVPVKDHDDYHPYSNLKR